MCVSPLLEVWRSAVAQSRALRSVVLQSVFPMSVSWLLSQWRAGYLSQVLVALYPDPHAAPFAPTSATSSSVVQRVVERRCLRPPVPTLPAAFKFLGCVLLPLRTVVRRWQQLRPQCANPTDALKLLQCTFTSLRAVLRRWWSRDLFGSHYSRPFDDIRPIDFRMRTNNNGSIHQHSLQSLNHNERVRIPAFCKHRYIRIRNAVLFKCTLMPVLSVIHRWWPHPADRPHLFAGKHAEEYLLSVRQDFDARGGNLAMLPSGWFYCMECKLF